VSGGGRCNVTHACFDVNVLVKNYPRGEKQLKGAFSRFMTTDTIRWFEDRGVRLKTEADGRMFPQSDSSQTIIDCLMNEAHRVNVQIETNTDIVRIEKLNDGKIELTIRFDERRSFDAVLIATGGSPRPEGFEWLRETGHTIIDPVPSLFTFNMPGNPVRELMGVAVDKAKIKITGTNFHTEGPLLITHWGMSGPTILKLSSIAARDLKKMEYIFIIRITWITITENDLRSKLALMRQDHSAKYISGSSEFPIPKRLWQFMVTRADIPEKQSWAQLSREQLNKLVTALLYDEYEVKGKTTFKEEFVTCGGVSLNDIDFRTLESKKMKGLYFAGEVLDVDAVTGGFNFQAAWTTGYIAGVEMGK
jgi:predicted Rossmann fold flavoprotein